MYVGDQEVDPQSLRTQAVASSTEWPDSFLLTTSQDPNVLTQDELSRLRDACISDAFLVNDVRVFTTVYGYKAGSSARHFQTPVEITDRLAHFFSDAEGLARFLAYCISTQGAALVLQFDPQEIVARLSRIRPDYARRHLSDIFHEEAALVSASEVRQLLRMESNSLLLYQSLHALEHATLSSAMQQIGNEALGSKLFPSQSTVMIFERASVGRGGVIQLVNRGTGLVQLIDASRDRMLGCAQGCRDGCPACVYVRDPHCNQPIEELGSSWLPPNSLLNRRGAAMILTNFAS